MKRCSRCEKTEPSSAKFCTGCGAPLEEARENPFRENPIPDPFSAPPTGESAGTPANDPWQTPPAAGVPPKPKRPSKALPIVITAAAIVVIIGLVAGVLLLKSRTTSAADAAVEDSAPAESEEETVPPSGILGGLYDTEAPEESSLPEDSEESQEPEEVPGITEEAPEESAEESPSVWTPVGQEETEESESPAVTHTYDGVTIQGDYVFSDSNSRYLSESELSGLSAQELAIARNEIFARYGRKFDSEALQAYFDSCDWYTPRYTPDEFAATVTLNDYEYANSILIKEYEKKMGYR